MVPLIRPLGITSLRDQVEVVEVGQVEHLEVDPLGAGVAFQSRSWAPTSSGPVPGGAD